MTKISKRAFKTWLYKELPAYLEEARKNENYPRTVDS